MPKPLRIRLLGSVRVEREGEQVAGFESQKSRALFGYLAVVGQPTSRVHLVNWFWPDKPEKLGRGNLSRVLSNFVASFPGCVQADRHAVEFVHGDDVWSDTNALSELTHQADVVSVQAAVELYQGDLMGDLFLDGCPDFEVWLAGEREHWKQQVVNVLNDLVAHYLSHKLYPQAVKWAARLVQLAPWREEGHRQLMLALALNDERGAALRQFQTCSDVLSQELDLTPSEGTLTLVEHIRSDTLEARPAIQHVTARARRLLERGHHLPVSSGPLLGRERACAEVDALLHRPECRLLTLVGPGGIGKTRLALEVAREVDNRYPDGIYFVPLASLSVGADLIPFFCDALACFVFGSDNPKTRLLNYVRGKDVLLLVDNFEHFTPHAGLLNDLLEAAPLLNILVTSRERLNLKREWIYELEGLALPTSKLQGKAASAVRLFVASAKQANPRFVLNERNLRDVARICKQVEGMPLGLELAAAATRLLSCEEIAEGIEAGTHFLGTPLRDLPERHHSLDAVFRHSWRLLSDEEKDTFKRLAVFRGGFERQAFLRVAPSSTAVLRALLDKSLLRTSTSGRYQMHGLLQHYAADKLREAPGMWDEVTHLHSAYYASLLQEEERRLRGPGQKEALATILTEFENVRLGWAWALEHECTDLVGRALGGLSLFYDLRSQYREGEDAFEKAVAALQKTQGVASLRAQLLARQGLFAFRLGKYDQAAHSVEASVATAKRVQRPLDEAYARNILGQIAHARGEFKRAKACYKAALETFTDENDRPKMASCINNLGNLLWTQGHYDQAKTLHQEALRVREALGDRWGVAASLNNLGAVAFHRKDYPEAKRLFQEGLELRETLKDQLGIAACLNNLGEIARRMHDHEQALVLHKRSLAMRRHIGDRIGVAYSLNNLGDTSLALGDERAALAYFQEAIQTALEAEALSAVLYMLVGKATLLSKQGKQERAVELLSFIQHHPASGQDTKERVAKRLAQLRTSVHPTVMERALTRGKSTLLEEWTRV